MKTICARKDGILALKQERIEAVRNAGGLILEFGESAPKDAIMLTDCRPRGFVGGRGPNDPAATAICTLNALGNIQVLFRFEDFGRALCKAKNLAAIL